MPPPPDVTYLMSITPGDLTNISPGRCGLFIVFIKLYVHSGEPILSAATIS